MGVIKNLVRDLVNDCMKPFISRFSYFQPNRHTLAANWNDISIISPIEGCLFVICQSIQKTQRISNTSACNNHWIKYVGKIVEQNLVITHADSHNNGELTTKSAFLYNKKLSASKKTKRKL